MQLKQALESLEALLLAPVARAQVRGVNTMEEFVAARKLGDWRAQDFDARTFLLSELFSFPLTLAWFLNQQQPADKTFCNVHIIGGKRALALICVNLTLVYIFHTARAEATLPDLYWLQLLNSTNRLQDKTRLHFAGLDVPTYLKPKTMQLGALSLQRTYAPGPYLEQDSKPDMAVFYNPGFASYQNSWKSALQALTAGDAPPPPILVTGYNQTDAERDLQFLSQTLPGLKLTLPIQENAFASRKQHAEGTTGRMARANHYLYAF